MVLRLIIYGCLNLFEKMTMPQSSRTQTEHFELWHRERQQFQHELIFPIYFVCDAQECFQREQLIELACKLMTVGFLCLWFWRFWHREGMPPGHQQVETFFWSVCFCRPTEERLRWSCLPLPILAMLLCPNFRTGYWFVKFHPRALIFLIFPLSGNFSSILPMASKSFPLLSFNLMC